MPKDQEVLTGEVTNYYHPSGNRPAKLIVAGAEETFELTIFPENGAEQPWDDSSKLPSFMDSLPGGPLDIAGVIIQAIAEPKGEYNGVKQYKPSKITVLKDGAVPKAAAPAAPAAATPAPPSIDQNQMRIMRQSTLHYASILVAPMVGEFQNQDAGKIKADGSAVAWLGSFDTPQFIVERTIQIAGKLLEYVISGEMPFTTEETIEEADDFGSL